MDLVEDDVADAGAPLCIAEQEDAQARGDRDENLRREHVVVAEVAREGRRELSRPVVGLFKARVDLRPHLGAVQRQPISRAPSAHRALAPAYQCLTRHLVDQRLGRRHVHHDVVVPRAQAHLHHVVGDEGLARRGGRHHQRRVPGVHHIEQPQLPGVRGELHTRVHTDARRARKVLGYLLELEADR